MSTAERLHREGREQGLEEGLVEGRRAILRQQLTRRFGPLPDAVGERLGSASIVDLDRWAERVLDAPSLAAVFAAD